MNSRISRPPARGPVAPIHRGPQALSPGAAYNVHAPNAALLIDFDNVTMGIRSDLQTELRHLLASEIIKGKVAVQRAYADWRRYPQYIVPLSEASIDLIFAPAYGSSKKNATDIRLAVDAIELVFTRPEIGTFILLSGDSDFSSLVIKLKEYGKYVIGVGIRESSSDLLVQNCDEYYSYNALAGLVRTSDEEVRKWDPWELVAESVQRMKRNGDVMRADRLKQVMQDIDPQFDEKNLGMAKFSKFVSEAAHRGLLALHKLENGQYEVGLPATRAVEEPEARPARDEAPREPREREPREGREAREGRDRGRRGRGRGRDREPREARDGETREFETREFEAREAEPTIPTSDELDAAVAALPRATPVFPAAMPAPAAPDRAPAAMPAATLAATPAASGVGDEIGLAGERLTRNEAFDLVRRAVESLTATDDDSVTAGQVRARAYELLGRDSASLSERNFERILQDAHGADVIDLRRRGDDFELSRAARVESVADQLNRAAAAQAAPAPTETASAGPRGMGPRSLARGRTARLGAPPPELLSLGVVRPAGAPAPSAAPSAPVPAAAAPPPPAPPALASAPPSAPAAAASVAPAAADAAPSDAAVGDGAAPRSAGRGRGRGGRKAATKAPAKSATKSAPSAPPASRPEAALPPAAAPGAGPARRGRGRGPARAAATAAPAAAPAPVAVAPAAAPAERRRAPRKAAAKKST